MYQRGYYAGGYAGGYAEDSPIMEYHAMKRPEEIIINEDYYVEKRGFREKGFEKQDFEKRERDRKIENGRNTDERYSDRRIMDEREVEKKRIDERNTDRRMTNGRDIDSRIIDERYMDRRMINERDIDIRRADDRVIDRTIKDVNLIYERDLEKRRVDERYMDERIIKEKEIDRMVIDDRDDDKIRVEGRNRNGRKMDDTDVERRMDERGVERRIVDRRDIELKKVEGRMMDERDMNRRMVDRRVMEEMRINSKNIDEGRMEEKMVDRKILAERELEKKRLRELCEDRRETDTRLLDTRRLDPRDRIEKDLERNMNYVDKRSMDIRDNVDRYMEVDPKYTTRRDSDSREENTLTKETSDVDRLVDRYDVNEGRRPLVKDQKFEIGLTESRKPLEYSYSYNSRYMDVDARPRREAYESTRRYDVESDIRVARDRTRDIERTDLYIDEERNKPLNVFQNTRRMEENERYFRDREANMGTRGINFQRGAEDIKDDFKNHVFTLRQNTNEDNETEWKDGFNKGQDVYQNTRRVETEGEYSRRREADKKNERSEFQRESIDAKDDFKNHSIQAEIRTGQEAGTMPIDREQRMRTMQINNQGYYHEPESPPKVESSTYHYEVSEENRRNEVRDGKYDGRDGRYDSRDGRYDGRDGRYDGREHQYSVREINQDVNKNGLEKVESSYGVTRDDRRPEVINETPIREADTQMRNEIVVMKKEEIDDGILKGANIETNADIYQQPVRNPPQTKLSKQSVSYYKPFKLSSSSSSGDKYNYSTTNFIGMGIFANEEEFSKRAEKFFSSISDGPSEKIGSPENNLHLTTDCVGFGAPREDSNYLKKFLIPGDRKNVIWKCFKSKNLIPVVHQLYCIKYKGTHGKNVFYYITKGKNSLACWAFRSKEPENINKIISEAINKNLQSISGHTTDNGPPLVINNTLEVKTNQDIQMGSSESQKKITNQMQHQVPQVIIQKNERIDHISDNRRPMESMGNNRRQMDSMTDTGMITNKYKEESSQYVGQSENMERRIVRYNSNDAPPEKGASKYEDYSETKFIKASIEVDHPRNYTSDDVINNEKVVSYTKPEMQEPMYSNRHEMRNEDIGISHRTSVEHTKIYFTDSDEEPTLFDTSKTNYTQPAFQQSSNYYTNKTDSLKRANHLEMYPIERSQTNRMEGGRSSRKMQANGDERIYRDNYADIRRKQIGVYNGSETFKNNRSSTVDYQYQQRSRADEMEERDFSKPHKKENDRSSRFQSDYHMSRTLEPQHKDHEFSLSHNSMGMRSSVDIDCLYLGMIRVNKIRGNDEIENSVEFLKKNTNQKNWARVILEISSVCICVSDYKMRDRVIRKCNLRHLSYAGIFSRNYKYGGFIEATDRAMLCHVFYIEPNASRFYRALSNVILKLNQDTMNSRLYSR